MPEGTHASLRLLQLDLQYPLFEIRGLKDETSCGIPVLLSWKDALGATREAVMVPEAVLEKEACIQARVAQPGDLLKNRGLTGPALAALLLGRSEASTGLLEARLEALDS
jgi:hypothetical protein